MSGIAAKIKTAIEALTTEPVTYLRAIHLQEANYQLPKTLLDQPVGIHANAPDIDLNTTILTTYTTFEYAVDVWFLVKNSSQDDKGEDIDVILDRTFLLANEFFQRMNVEASGLPAVTDYTLTPVVNWSDEMLSGYNITFNLPDRVTDYVCP